MKIIEQNNLVVAVVENDSPQITSAQSALDLLVEAQYGFGCSRLAVPREALPGGFLCAEHRPCRRNPAKIH